VFCLLSNSFDAENDLCLVWLSVLLMCGTLKEMSNRKTGGDKQHERKRLR